MVSEYLVGMEQSGLCMEMLRHEGAREARKEAGRIAKLSPKDLVHWQVERGASRTTGTRRCCGWALKIFVALPKAGGLAYKSQRSRDATSKTDENEVIAV